MSTPTDWVRDYIQAHRNHFPELDEAGEAIGAELGAIGWDFEAAAVARLAAKHKIRVQVMPTEVMVDNLRRYDIHRRRLMIAETLAGAGRGPAVAYQLAQTEGRGAEPP